MGCCSSRPSAPQPNSPYPAAAHENSSSHLRPPNATSSVTNHPSSASRNRSDNLSEHYNAPLRRHAWVSRNRSWSRASLDREREVFFHTQTSGRPEIWDTLRMVIQLMNDGDMATAQSMFDAAGCTAPTGNLINGVYDAHGALYQIPENIICDPVDLDESKKVIEDGGEEEAAEEQKRREEKGKAVLRGETLKVRCRLSDSHGKDVVIQMGREETVRVLIGRIKEQTGVSPSIRVSIAYMGRMFKEHESLLAQGWREGHIVNALVFIET